MIGNFINRQKSLISNIKNGKPSEKMKVIGVAGTRGKTSLSHILYDLLKASGVNVGVISSIGYSDDSETFNDKVNANNIDSGQLHSVLNRMRANGIDFAIVETTSKNLSDSRYEGVIFDSGVLLNIFHDNKMHYPSWEDYAQTKLDFINKIKDGGYLLLNAYDQRGLDWVYSNEGKIVNNVYADILNPQDLQILRHNLKDGLRFKFGNNTHQTNLLSRNNLLNLVLASRLASNYVQERLLFSNFANVNNPFGRMELVSSENVNIVIDSANTPELMEESLRELNAIKHPDSAIITVFGCPGGKDTYKRNMSIPALKYSSMVVLCANDPKFEFVSDINTDIFLRAEEMGGIMVERFQSTDELKMINKENLKLRINRVILNGDTPFIAFDADNYSSRLDAIRFAIGSAKDGDIVYIAGKGHETSLTFKGIEYEWSDHEAVSQVLDEIY